MNAGNSTQIGRYHLGEIPLGLKDCSRYLLMPKFTDWPSLYLEKYAPFQIGWPTTRASPFIRPTKSIVEAIQQMVLTGSIGKKIIDPSKCEWSRLVNDLRGNYLSVQMNGYGGQSRINKSLPFCSFVFKSDGDLVRRTSLGAPPFGYVKKDFYEIDESPSISIVKVTIKTIHKE
jgi:hypothetical protein